MIEKRFVTLSKKKNVRINNEVLKYENRKQVLILFQIPKIRHFQLKLKIGKKKKT